MNKKVKTLELLVAVLFVFVGIALRLLPHLPNFAPITAIALFGGVYLSRKVALVLPLAAMLVSDMFIGFYEPQLMLFVYGSFILSVFLGFWLKGNKKWQNVLASSAFCALMFFIITNFAVWLFTPWYAKSAFGLAQCYVMALPFLRNSLLGDVFYTGLFFGLFELAEVWIRNKFKAAVSVAA